MNAKLKGRKFLGRNAVLRLGSFLVLALWTTLAMADDNFGALAFSTSNGSYGYAGDYGSRASAEEAALSQCDDRTCTVVLWFKNACGALAAGDGHGYSTGWASSRGEAESTAMSNCNSNASHCAVLRWQCTTR